MSAKKRIKVLEAKNFSQASFSRDGRYLVSTRGDKSEIRVHDRFKSMNIVAMATPAYVRAPIVRTYLKFASDERVFGHELVYARGDESGIVYREDILTSEAAPELKTNCKGVQCLVESHDGRYVAVGGSSHGDVMPTIEIWDFDGAEPFRLCSFTPNVYGDIACMTFNRCNTELYFTLTTGEIYKLGVFQQTSLALHSQYPWRCYSLACQPNEDDGLALAGEYGKVWFINSPYKTSDAFGPEDAPVTLVKGHTVTGMETQHVAGITNSKIGFLEANIGSCIRWLKFLNDNELLLVSDKKAAIWNLATEIILETRDFDDEGTVLAVGSEGHKALIAFCCS